MNPRTQKFIENLEKNFTAGGIQFEELKEVFEVLLSAIKAVKDDIEQKMAQNKGQISDELENVLFELKEKELKLENLINKSKEFTLSEVKNVAKQLNEQVDRLEQRIPAEADLSEIEFKIAELERRPLPEEIKAEKVRDKLESLKGDERLDISAIKGLGKRLAKLTDDIVNRALSILDNRTQFLLAKVSNLQDQVNGMGSGSGGGHVIEDEGTPLTQRSNLNFTGAGVSVADTGGKTVVTITGSAGAALNKETPTGTIDDSNVTFTVSNEPFFINVNGGIYEEGDGVYSSYSGGTITLTSAVGTGGFIKSYY